MSSRKLPICLILLCCLLWTLPVHAAQPSCADPQAATRSLLDWLQPDNYDPQAAATCLDLTPGRKAEGPGLAVKLKAVLDARGMYVDTDSLPTDPDYTNDEDRAVVEPVPRFPDLRIRKVGDQWLIARSTLQAVPDLYNATFTGLSGEVRDRLPAQFSEARVLGLRGWQWAYALILVGLSTLLGLLVQGVLAWQLRRIARRAGINLNAKVVRHTRVPIALLVIGLVAHWGIADLQLGVRLSQTLLFFANTATSLTVVVLLVRLVNTSADYFIAKAKASESKLDDHVVPLAMRASKILIWALGIMFIVQNMGFEIASLLAGVSIGGVAVALAAKDTVENLFGSVLIFLDKPFQIGDWVIVDGDVEGVVEQVGFRSTRVRTFYNSVVSVPNRKVANARVDNMGLRRFRRVKTTLGLTYDTPRDKVEAFVAGIRRHLAENPAVAESAACEIHFAAFGPSSLDVMLYFFLDVPGWTQELDERARCYLAFMKLAEELEVEFAFPTQTLHLASAPPLSAKAG